MSALSTWMRKSDAGPDAAFEAHHKLSAIRPFHTGNRATALLLCNLILNRAGYPPVVVLANWLRKGPGLKASQVVATGSFSGFFPVEIGQRIVADFEGVGSAEAMFVK